MEKLKGRYRKFRFPAFLSTTASEGQTSGASFEKAYQEGLEQGREKGFDEGINEGIVQGRDQGRKEGFDHGYQDGQQSGKSAFDAAIEALSGVADAFNQAKSQKASDHVDQLCVLVEQVAKKVIRAELTLNSDQILKLVSEGLDQVETKKDETAYVHLSTEDAERLKKQGVSDIHGFEYRSDDKLKMGQCRIETENQELTVSTDERLENCMESVKENLSETND